MGRGPNLFFNIVSILFVVLTLLVLGVTVGVMTDSMDPPFLEPQPTDLPPTIRSLPGGTPTPIPDVVETPVETPVDAPDDASAAE